MPCRLGGAPVEASPATLEERPGRARAGRHSWLEVATSRGGAQAGTAQIIWRRGCSPDKAVLQVGGLLLAGPVQTCTLPVAPPARRRHGSPFTQSGDAALPSRGDPALKNLEIPSWGAAHPILGSGHWTNLLKQVGETA